jgi:HAE1 family hydrophobic/amphiphilic exporter-1
VRPTLASIPDVRTTFLGGWSGAEVMTVLTSENGPRARSRRARAAEADARRETIAAVRPTDPPTAPELVITPKVEEAARLGVSAASIALIARVASIGDVDFNVPKFSEGERRLPIRVRLPETARSNLDAIRGLKVPTANGGDDHPRQRGRHNLPGGLLADLAARPPAPVGDGGRPCRRRGARPGHTGDQRPAHHEEPAEGVERAAFGDVEAMIDMMTGLVMALGAGIFLIYGVMVLLFGSFFKPVTILSALPLSLGGAFPRAAGGGMGLFLPSLIGF